MSSKIVQIVAVASLVLGTASATLAAPRNHVRKAPAPAATVQNQGNQDYSAFAASRASGAVRTPAAGQRVPEPLYFSIASDHRGD
jgi:hypothetical protein